MGSSAMEAVYRRENGGDDIEPGSSSKKGKSPFRRGARGRKFQGNREGSWKIEGAEFEGGRRRTFPLKKKREGIDAEKNCGGKGGLSLWKGCGIVSFVGGKYVRSFSRRGGGRRRAYGESGKKEIKD